MLLYNMQPMRSSCKKLANLFLSVKDETYEHENINDDTDEIDLYEMDKLSLDLKKNISVRLKSNPKI